MVKITYQPIQEIVIFEVVAYDTPENLATTLGTMIRAGQPVILSWCDGVVFLPMPLQPMTDNLAEAYLNGKIYWNSVVYSLMPSYSPIVHVESDTLGSLDVPVMNVTENKFMKDIASWLKEFKG